MEGIRLWREMQPDIAIVDLAMPGVDGLAVLKELRGDGAMIIVLTAYGDIESAMTALKRGSGADPSPPASAVAEDVFLE